MSIVVDSSETRAGKLQQAWVVNRIAYCSWLQSRYRYHHATMRDERPLQRLLDSRLLRHVTLEKKRERERVKGVLYILLSRGT